MRPKYIAVLALAAGLCCVLAQPASAQTYPSRTVSIIVPYPAGGSVDGVARIITQKLNETLGQHFIVDNRAGGAGGAVGANYVAKANPDGATLLLTASIHVVTPFLNKNIPYDVVKDFTPITLIAVAPLLVSASPSVPANTLKEFFDLVRKDPNKYTFATSSFGSAGHLAIEMLKRDAGIDTLVIAYKGAGPALNDLMGGQVQLMVDPMLSSLPLAQSKAIKALAITSAKRSPAAPDIPTVAESGMTGGEFASWYGLWGPKNLPQGIVDKLQQQIAEIIKMPDVKQRLDALGFEPVGSAQDYFVKYIANEMEKSGRIISDAKIRTE
jgi:tripartite-type tricarboxylate transporter receptor subunit TctC